MTNYAGGNTSSKSREHDPITGELRDVLWVKGSGGDLGTLERDGVAALDLTRLRGLERTYRGIEHEDEQVALLLECLVPPRGAAPSIDTPLHGLLPYPQIDHVHPDSVIALATAEGGEALVERVYSAEVGWLPWQRPGFDLALRLRDLVERRPDLRGVVLGGHGLISWGADSDACYANTIELIELATEHLLAERVRRGAPPFGERTTFVPPPAVRRRRAAWILPLLRGLTSGEARTIGHFRDDEVVLDFTSGANVRRLVAEGTSCPDHFLRTKQRPLLLELAPEDEPELERLAATVEAYRRDYADYYGRNADGSTPPLRSSDPVVLLWPGIGMFTLAKSKREARIAAEFYVNAINVMAGAETVSSYVGLSEPEAFRIEYWELEEAKLARMPPERPLQRRVALVTGATGGIGRAIARRLVAEGAAVVLADLDREGLDELVAELGEETIGTVLDVTDEESVAAAFELAALTFGGVDIVVNNAGLTISKPLVETSLDDYERLHAVIDRGSFIVSRAFTRQVLRQGIGGDLVYVISKNAVFAGPDNVAYGAAKASQLHQMRLLAAELGEHGIRVNGINPDAVVQGSKLFAGAWREDRAAKYGVAPEQLGEYYAQRSILKREVLPEDVAQACFVLLAGGLDKTTGAVIPVDGGVASAFLR